MKLTFEGPVPVFLITAGLANLWFTGVAWLFCTVRGVSIPTDGVLASLVLAACVGLLMVNLVRVGDEAIDKAYAIGEKTQEEKRKGAGKIDIRI